MLLLQRAPAQFAYRDNASGHLQVATPGKRKDRLILRFGSVCRLLHLHYYVVLILWLLGPPLTREFFTAVRSVNDLTPPPTARPKQRNSILVAASDALSFSLRRSKRATIHRTNNQKQRPSVVDEVLEISAEAAQKDELAERERLRDAAAQAVGLGGTTPSESTMAGNTMDDVSVISSHTRSAKRTTLISIAKPLSQPNQNMSALPPYPATLHSLQPFIQHSSVLLKYYPSQSAFLKLQKSRQWKLRHLVLTSFRCPSESDSSAGTGDNATQAQLHLFKSSNADEKEIERLSINQDSVIYVADGGFGGNKEFVVKVAGCQRGEGASSSSNNSPSTAAAAATVWLLQLPDLAQMQRWIQFIKSSVLTQRCVLGAAFTRTNLTVGH